MPDPSSLTRIRRRPPSSREISTYVAPASIEFSTSSLTTDEGRSTTSPAAIWSATAAGRMEITGMVISKLPTLTPRWSGHVFLLMLALDIRLFVFRRFQDCLRLLPGYSGHGLGSGRLIGTLRRCRTWR